MSLPDLCGVMSLKNLNNMLVVLTLGLGVHSHASHDITEWHNTESIHYRRIRIYYKIKGITGRIFAVLLLVLYRI